MLGEEGIRRKAAPDFQLNLVAYAYRALLQSMLQSTATEHATITVLRTLQRDCSQSALLQSMHLADTKDEDVSEQAAKQ